MLPCQTGNVVSALVVNCCGLGDGLIEVPFLKSITESRGVRFLHTGGTLFRDSSLVSAIGLQGYVGMVPAEWRKFAEADWPAILGALEAEGIKLIINLRHIGPKYDSGYFRFRERYGGSFEFMNFDFGASQRRDANIRDRIEALLSANGLIDGALDRSSLRSLVTTAATVPGRIVVNMHTGGTFKQWCPTKWRALCETLVAEGWSLAFLAGHSAEERATSEEVVGSTNRRRLSRTTLVPSTDVVEVLELLASAEYLISTDSWPVHAATAVGVRTVGLYIVSSPEMWGGEPAFALPVESAHLRSCENYDDVLGICRNGYVQCPLIEQNGDGIEVGDVLARLNRNVSLRT